MSDYFCVHVVEGRHVVGYTTSGLDFYPLPRAAFGSPRDAVRFAEMRQANVSPLRPGSEVPPTHGEAASTTVSAVAGQRHKPAPDTSPSSDLGAGFISESEARALEGNR
jgi:hypothetical protein